MKKVLVAGGGSGGHITPVISVTNEILEERPRTEIHFWTDFGFYAKTCKLIEENRHQLSSQRTQIKSSNIKLYRIVSGKFRRYSHFKAQDYIKHPSIMLSNFLDLIKVGFGFFQSLFMLLFWRPDVVFLKGGFVCLPIGLAAHLLHIPTVIHDSDTIAGLTNRILAKHSTRVLSGMPESNLKNAEFVGIPVSDQIKPLSRKQQADLKTSLGFNPDLPVTLFTGGGLGAQRLNEAVIKILPELQEFTQVFLITGKTTPIAQSMETLYHTGTKKASVLMDSRINIVDFVPNMPEVMKAADLVVARAGATTIAELAAAGKPTLLIPNAKLPGEHQVKNAESLKTDRATEIFLDDDLNKPKKFLEVLHSLIKNPNEREVLSSNIHKLARPKAAKIIANIIISTGQKK